MATNSGARIWTDKQDERLRNLYPETSNAEIARAMGRTKPSINNRAIKLGLKKTDGYMEHEKPGQFGKGGEPWNKGLHYRAGGRSAETQFRPGRAARNRMPIGTEVVDSYGNLKRKVRNDAPRLQGYKNWKFVHVINWEEVNGPLPEGHIVRFRDRDITNVDPDNLVAVSRAEHAVINRWMAMGELPEGGIDVLITLARIKIAARKRQEEVAQ